MSLTKEQIEGIRTHGCCAVNRDWQALCDMALRAAEPAQPVTSPQMPLMKDGTKLWLWKNGDHTLAYAHEYPCYETGGDPLTLGEPVGVAIFKESSPRAVRGER